MVKKPFDVEHFVTTVREVTLAWSAEAQPAMQAVVPLDVRPAADSVC